MKKSLLSGISFGLVSGVLTTLGLLIGLAVGTQSKITVVIGILTIAVADALSDSFGIHLSKESEGNVSNKNIWSATVATFLSKFFFAITFVVPVLLMNVTSAVIVSILWGLSLVIALSVFISKSKNKGRGELFGVITEHLTLFLLVILSSYFVGKFLNSFIS